MPDTQYHSDPESDEGVNRQPQIPALRNAYESDDNDEGAVKVEEEEGGTSLSILDLTIDLGIEMEDGDDEEMEWDKQSTDSSSCDSDFYDTD